MQLQIINDGRGGITLTATGKEDAAILSRFPEVIELRRTDDGYSWTPPVIAKKRSAEAPIETKEPVSNERI